MLSDKERIAVLESQVKELKENNVKINNQINVVLQRQDILASSLAQIHEEKSKEKDKRAYFG